MPLPYPFQSSTVITTLPLFILLSYLIYRIYLACFSPLSKIPSAHPSAPFSSFWLLLQKYKARENHARHTAHEKLGPIVRIGPKEVSVNCVENGVRTIYSGKFDKPMWYMNAFWGDEMPYTFTTLKHQAHTERRKMVSAMYSHSYIYSSPALLKITRSIIDARFIPKIRKQADENDVIDVLRENKSCMMDITSAFLFGQSQATNFLQNSNEAGDFFETYQPSHYGHFWRTEFYSMTRFLAWFGIHLVPKQAHKARREVKIWCANMCDGALSYLQTHVKPSFESTSTEDYPMVYAHFRKNLQKVDSLSERNIEEMMIVELLDHLFASHDIPGITTAYVMYQLSQHIEMQRELRAELQGWKKESGIESFHELDKLPLLDAIFMETLRRHGPNPGPWPRYTSKESTRLGEYFDVPPGTIFSASSYCLHRNAEVFPEPEKWLPERWVNIDMQKEKQMRSWFWAFGAGSRGCFGRHFAIYTMKALIAAVYIEFETRVVDGSGMEQSDGFIAGPVGEKVLLRFHRV